MKYKNYYDGLGKHKIPFVTNILSYYVENTAMLFVNLKKQQLCHYLLKHYFLVNNFVTSCLFIFVITLCYVDVNILPIFII